MKQFFLPFLVVFFAIFLFSCAHVSVDSNPREAQVKINGRSFGETPTVPIRIRKQYPIEISKNGYETFYGKISPDDRSPYHVDLKRILAGYIDIQVINEDGNIFSIKEKVHAETDTIERSPNVKSVRKITDISEYSWLESFQVSPDGRQIVFAQYEEELLNEEPYSNLWTISTSGGPVRRITQGKYFDRSPSLSSDGKFLYFSSNRLDTFDIWSISFFTGEGLSLRTNSSMMQEDFPSVSEDGFLLLFTALTKGTKIKQIWTLGLKNNELFQLREGAWPKYFNNDSSIIFSGIQRTTGEWKIWTMNKDGSSPMQISTTNGSNDIHASVSPDGTKIVFASDRGVSNGMKNYDIWLCNIDGSNLIQLTTNGSRDDMPIFSPDGRYVFFRSNRGVKWDIWSMELAI